jgi:hypothetical protein
VQPYRIWHEETESNAAFQRRANSFNSESLCIKNQLQPSPLQALVMRVFNRHHPTCDRSMNVHEAGLGRRLIMSASPNSCFSSSSISLP